MYTRHPFENNWEYKIVRARNNEFRYRHHLDALLQQEALAGWEIVEKYNDSQIRFKRPRSARTWDGDLPPHIDPYRTIYHPSAQSSDLQLIVLTMSLIIIVLVIATLGILASLPG
ncbi:MAG: hypothetical protein JXA10_11935 [Anaerolineae bacterium]|nr:hypothetical protein [Anaerolineae bacterium]